MSEEELRRYYAIFTECWKLFRKYSNPDDSDKFWDNLIDESQELYEKDKNEFRKNMIVETINEIERIWKLKGGGKHGESE